MSVSPQGIERGQIDCRIYYRQSGSPSAGSLILHSRFEPKRMHSHRQGPPKEERVAQDATVTCEEKGVSPVVPVKGRRKKSVHLPPNRRNH